MDVEIVHTRHGLTLHLILGALHTQMSLPIGTYTADIGIYQTCTFNFCLANPFAAPDFAEAGFFTINVLAPGAVPEPGTIWIFAAGLAALASVRRRQVLAPTYPEVPQRFFRLGRNHRRCRIASGDSPVNVFRGNSVTRQMSCVRMPWLRASERYSMEATPRSGPAVFLL